MDKPEDTSETVYNLSFVKKDGTRTQNWVFKDKADVDFYAMLWREPGDTPQIIEVRKTFDR